MKLLIIKNGVCETDIDKLLLELNPKLDITLRCSRNTNYSDIKPDIYCGVIILGGGQRLSNIDDINNNHRYLFDLISQIRLWIQNDIPLLGICLGAQLIALSLGHAVRDNSELVDGYDQPMVLTDLGRTDPLFGYDVFPFESTKSDFLSLHHDRIELKEDGEDVDLLCELQTDHMRLLYAFRYKKAIGVQFHPDITPRILQTFCSEFKYDEMLIKRARNRTDAIHKASLVFFGSWLRSIAL